MPRSEEAEMFFYAVYSAVQEIPPGKVTSYGHIAWLVGTRQFLAQSSEVSRTMNVANMQRKRNDLAKSAFV